MSLPTNEKRSQSGALNSALHINHPNWRGRERFYFGKKVARVKESPSSVLEADSLYLVLIIIVTEWLHLRAVKELH